LQIPAAIPISVKTSRRRTAANDQLVFQQYRFSHNGAHSTRAHDFGDGGQQVDGEYEKVNHRYRW